MERLKHLLFEEKTEQSFEKAADTLLELKNSSDWIVKDPVLFRGKKTIGKFDYIEFKKTGKREKTQDTPFAVDEILHGFYKNCYTEYPKRRTSRFATTEMEFARNYGDTLFVIIPHKDTKISNYPEDPINLFRTIKAKIERLKKLYEGTETEDLPEEIERVIESLLSIYRWNEKWKVLNQVPCPGKMLEKIESYEKEEPNSLYSPLREVFLYIKKYFDDLKKGYPKKDALDVMFEGYYFQVYAEVFEVTIGL